MKTFKKISLIIHWLEYTNSNILFSDSAIACSLNNVVVVGILVPPNYQYQAITFSFSCDNDAPNKSEMPLNKYSNTRNLYKYREIDEYQIIIIMNINFIF